MHLKKYYEIITPLNNTKKVDNNCFPSNALGTLLKQCDNKKFPHYNFVEITSNKSIEYVSLNCAY